MTTQPYDLIILGGGCSGLAIGHYFSKLKSKLRIAIIEKRKRYDDDRSWCFWLADPEFEHQDIICQRWSKWLFSEPNQTVIHHSKQIPYALIKSIDYYQKTTESILKDPRQQLFLDNDVESIRKQNGIYEIKTNSGEYTATCLIDTRPKQADIITRASIFQIFYGLEIKTREPIFDASTAHLMSNLNANDDFCQFDYLLPISNDHALVEITRFSKTHHAPNLLQELCYDLINKLTKNYEVLRQESAILPMGIPKQNQQPSSFYNLSQQYGTLRPSSGYGFLRLQHQAKKLANQLVANQVFTEINVDSSVDRWMDICFCKVLYNQMQLAPTLFMNMASTLSAENFALFMNGSINWRLRWQVIKSMPTGPFLRSLL